MARLYQKTLLPLKVYTSGDVALLIKTGNAHRRLSELATKEILRRGCEAFRQELYRNIGEISPSHIYNSRNTRQYQLHSLIVVRTVSVKNSIRERRRLESQDKSGYLRLDSVSQGDLEKEKGVYHINTVDEVIK